MFDTLANLLTGMGVLGKDKSVGTGYAFIPLTRDQLDNAYRGDWVARKAVNIPAQDSTREWRAWQAEKKDITDVEEEEKRLDVQRKLKRAMILGRLYGGGALLIGAGDQDVTKELKPESVSKGGLRYLHQVSCNQLKANEPNTDVESEWFGQPSSYRLTSRNNVIADIHPSRIVRFLGNELADPEALAVSTSGWGDSALQAVDDAIKGVGVVTQGVSSLVQEAKLDIVQMPGMDEMVSTAESRNLFQSRIQFMNVMKSLFSVTLLDERDKWDRKEVSFGSLPETLQMYLLIVSGAVDIPVTRFLGQSPAGLNATGESDTRNYYDRLKSEQTTELTPTMRVLDRCLLASALGSIPDDVWYEWRPLWASTDSEKADIALKKAQAFQIDATVGIIAEDALREGRENQLIEDGTYPGFEQALEEAEAMQEAALNEMDPEVRAMAEQHKLAQKAGLPMLPAPGAAPGQPPGAAGAANGGGLPSPSGGNGKANGRASLRAGDSLVLTASEGRKRRLAAFRAKRGAGARRVKAVYEAGWIEAAAQMTLARKRKPKAASEPEKAKKPKRKPKSES